MIWDSGPLRPDGAGGVLGTPPAPITNTPPREGKDPHSAPRSDADARIQKSEFLKIDGRVVDVCGTPPVLRRAAGPGRSAAPASSSTHSQ